MMGKNMPKDVKIRWIDLHPVSPLGKTSDFDQKASLKMLNESRVNGDDSLAMLYGQRIIREIVELQSQGHQVVLLECGLEVREALREVCGLTVGKDKKAVIR